MATSRKSVRGAVLTALDPYAASADVTFDYKPDTLNGRFPAVAIEAAGSERQAARFGGGFNTTFFYTIHLFILYAKPGEWTKAQADDALDTLEHEVAQFVEANKRNDGNWEELRYNGQTVILDDVDMGGERYLNEQIPISVQVYG